ncbi:MAG: hypothetical protein ACK5A3_18245, partial [Planctomyces sp.]
MSTAPAVPVAEVVCPPLRPSFLGVLAAGVVPVAEWCVPNSGLSPAGFVLRDDDHCVSFRVFASSRETNGVVCP